MTTLRRLTLITLAGLLSVGMTACKPRASHFVRHAVNRKIAEDAQKQRTRQTWRKHIRQQRPENRVNARFRARLRTR